MKIILFVTVLFVASCAFIEVTGSGHTITQEMKLNTTIEARDEDNEDNVTLEDVID